MTEQLPSDTLALINILNIKEVTGNRVTDIFKHLKIFNTKVWNFAVY